mgnify:CR=1 FL=1
MTDQPIGSEIGRKLSVGEMGFDKLTIQGLVASNREADHFLARFVGVVTSLKPYKIREGERAGEVAYGLMGQFEGTANDGTVLKGSVLYLPGYANDMVIAAMQSGGAEDVVSVRIGFDVYARFDADAATSYVFTVRDLLNTQQTGVEEVKAQIQALPLPSPVAALPAPKRAK